MLKSRMNLRLFANLDEILTQNAQAFEGTNTKENYTSLNEKLSGLGYDILINNKKQAEFVPVSRLNDVVSQRDTFKTQAETLNGQIEEMKKSAKGNDALMTQLDSMKTNNDNLLKELEDSKVKFAIVSAAKDAVDPNDITRFINMENVKLNSKGEVTGVEAEVARVKSEKPYLFTNADTKKKKAGADLGGGGKEHVTVNMNEAIRRAAGRG